MGNLAAVTAAFILRIYGVNIFREPKDVGGGPLLSSYMFLFSSYLLLYDLRLYPQSLRALGRLSQFVVEFFIAEFLMENILLDFWFPLEILVMDGLNTVSDQVEELLQSGNWPCDTFCDALKSDNAKMGASYVLSVFFLLAVLHAIRAIDLRALKEGPRAFFGDIFFRLKKFLRKKMRSLGFGRRRVKIKENKSKTRKLKGSKTKVEDSDEECSCCDCNSEFDLGDC